MSSVFFVLLKLVNNTSIKEQLKTLAYWNLWLGTGFSIITAIAGWFAYNSVVHDTPSHEAMTDHRNWAIVTLLVFIGISLWSVKQYKSIKETGLVFTFVMVMALVLLMSTGWRGSEAVYRYGLGVMSLPQSEGEGHAHEHPSDNSETKNSQHDEMNNSHSDSLDSADHHDGDASHSH